MVDPSVGPYALRPIRLPGAWREDRRSLRL